MGNKEGIRLLEEQIGLERMLDHLEKECGGMGNGLVLYKKNKVIYIKKGLDYSNKSIARKILTTDFDYCQYHTRVVSVAAKSDANCHPFYNSARSLVVMMNGTEREIGTLSSSIGITDTEMVFRMLRDYDIPLSALEKMSARYMGFQNGKVFICNSITMGLKFIRDKNAFIVASSFPKLVKCEDLKTGLWMQGDKIEAKKPYQYSRPTNGWNDYSGYGNYGSKYTHKVDSKSDGHVIPATAKTPYAPTWWEKNLDSDVETFTIDDRVIDTNVLDEQQDYVDSFVNANYPTYQDMKKDLDKCK